MNFRKGFINPLWLVVALVIIIGGGGVVYWYTQQPAPRSAVQQPIILPIAEEAKIDAEEEQRAKEYNEAIAVQQTDPTIQAIRKALIASTTDLQRQDYYKEVEVATSTEGQRYVLFYLITYRTIGPPDSIFDKQTGQIIGSLPEGRDLEVVRGRVVISRQDICYYYIDQPACKPIPGARLSGNEVYPYGFDWPVFPHASTTESILTVGVYDRDPATQNAKGLGETTEIRTKTFTLP